MPALEVVFTTEEVLDAMADTVTPQGIVAVAKQSPTSVRDVFAASPRLIAICEEVRDPGNLGTIIRAADAAGADAVVLTGRTVDLYNPKVVRASTGSIFHLPVAVGVDLATAVERAHARRASACSPPTSGEATSSPRAPLLAEPTAWLFGNEARGLDEEALALADLVAAAADLRPRRVAESRDRGERLPLRDRLRAARRRLTPRIPRLLQVGKGPRRPAAGDRARP